MWPSFISHTLFMHQASTPTSFISIALLLFLLIGCGPSNDPTSVAQGSRPISYGDYVNLFIGTQRGESEHPGARGNTHPGATTPWGMVATSPQTSDFRKTRSSTGYRAGMDSIYGFSCINFSGIGCPAGGSVPIKFSSGAFDVDNPGSSFSDQVASPGYYGVYLDSEAIKVETSVTTRSTIFRLQFPKGENYIYLDLTAQQGHVKGGEVVAYSDKSVSGYQLEGFFCGSDTMGKTFFHADLEQKPDSAYLMYQNKSSDRFKQGLDAKPSGIVYKYTSSVPMEVQLKVGISFVSEANAKENVVQEQPGFDFEDVRRKARARWENELGKIAVSSDNEDDKTVFYSALYHSLLMPMTYSDVNGDYILQGSGDQVGNAKGYTRYTGFSLWDTYRTVHPLLTLVYPEKQLDMVRSMVAMYEEAGRLPKWEIFGQEPNIMVGDPSAIVIADTYMKGVRDFDVQAAYKGMTQQAEVYQDNMMRRGLKEYLQLGYVSMDGEFADVSNFQWKNGIVWGAVSTTLEFNLADYGIAKMAKAMNKADDYERYHERSLSFLKLYDAKTGLLRPKNRDGSWYEPFAPTQARWDQMNFGLRGGPGYVEGSAWNYLFSVPHGIGALQQLMGPDTFLKQLERIFNEGHFDMTNEPGLGFPFMYNHTQFKNTKTAATVHACLETYFRNVENGLPGNDDAGTMSAWVVFAMMGMYPHTPGEPAYTFTTPTFDFIRIRLDTSFYKNNEITIERSGPKKGPIQQMTLNGRHFDYWLEHAKLTDQKSEVLITTEASEN